jgi:hypothetical protein
MLQSDEVALTYDEKAVRRRHGFHWTNRQLPNLNDHLRKPGRRSLADLRLQFLPGLEASPEFHSIREVMTGPRRFLQRNPGAVSHSGCVR